MELRWKASMSATCLHAANCAAEGLEISDPQLANALQPAIDQLHQELVACGLPFETTLPLLGSLAAEYENNRQLVEVTVTKLRGAGSICDDTIARLAGSIADLEVALLRERPNLADELAVRGRPLRELWEARGPGLLREVARLVGDESFLVSSAEIVLVAPLAGGHGRASRSGNRVTFEAVLVDPYPELPETIRLGWLLAQLGCHLPRFGEAVSGNRLPQVASLATLPLVLAAAETVELAMLSPDSIEQALRCWQLPQEVRDCLHTWWQAYFTGNSRWAVALASLDAMLAS